MEKFQKIIRIKKNKLAEELLQYLRASLIFSYQTKFGNEFNNGLKQLLVSVPVDTDFEIYILKTGIDLVKQLLCFKYPTQLSQDLEILETPNLNYRTYLAVTHRVAQKEALKSQQDLLTILLFLVEQIKFSSNLKEAYMTQHESESSQEIMMLNRIRCRKYF